VNTDGSAASGNPFSSSTNANAKKVYSLGHRNSFGLTFHPSTGQLWESENGPNDNDEVNRIVAGGNYGWPNVGGIVSGSSYRNPVVAFNPVIAPTGIVGIPSTSSVYPSSYRGNVLVAAFNGGTIRLVTSTGTTSVVYPGGVSGLLSLMLSSDGYVYASTADSIFRVTVTPNLH
jgi:aldose sugar dehydrogenase